MIGNIVESDYRIIWKIKRLSDMSCNKSAEHNEHMVHFSFFNGVDIEF